MITLYGGPKDGMVVELEDWKLSKGALIQVLLSVTHRAVYGRLEGGRWSYMGKIPVDEEKTGHVITSQGEQ